MNKIDISVIIVARNSEVHIEKCIESILLQFDEKSHWELIIVDGMSNDRTLEKCKILLSKKKIKYIVINNPQKTLASGWNIGIKNSNGSYIIRPDAHSTLQKGYLNIGINILKKMKDVTVVGGLLETKAAGFWGKIIKEALSSKVGVGNSRFRTGSTSGYVDTAVYGIYRSEIFKKVGLFNESLIRHQDNEMHKRITKMGGKFYLCKDMVASYYCRDSIRNVLKQMFLIGFYLPVAGLRSFQLRHFAPLILFLVNLIGIPLSYINVNVSFAIRGIDSLYLFLIIFEFIKRSIAKNDISIMLNCILVPIMHCTYGFGTFIGILRIVKLRSFK
ncbi:MAG: glycosyltransferase family 2 protein [Candidatus Thermoplasmatota archaeon]|nr:glycosyltransferase family 2 protein [Candidatus Thermoplasmatota archaeon]